MLTAEQIEALRDRAGMLTTPITDYLISDIARRIARAGELTATASYEIWRAQQLGISQREIKKRLRKLLKVSHRELRQLLTQAAETGYHFDAANFPQVQAVPFAQNEGLQKIVSAAVKLARKDFTNLTQTLGMVDPRGKVLPLRDAYQSAMDFAHKQVVTGAADYNTAIRQATKNLAEKGLRVIDYESGVHTSLEAAVRRSVMGGLGLMQEQISQKTHDEMGADGWEISAHAASAPDHEPIQGRQYSDAEYKALNDSLQRRIGTLNCGHAAFPIILGISQPQYSEEELEDMRRKNVEGITYQGRHYSMYEATQKQRQLERTIRRQRRRILADEAAGDAEKLTTDQIRLVRLEDEYRRFSKAAGLRTQTARLETAGFGPGQAVEAVVKANAGIAKIAKADIIKSGGDKMTVDVEIDQFTPCLLDKHSGEIVDTEYTLAAKSELVGLKKRGWLFNWRHESLKDSEVYKLTVKGDHEIQGLVAIEAHPNSYAYHLSLAESAPHNKGESKRYDGVGGHLFAIAAKKSADAGFGGFIYFEAKNIELVQHYHEKFGAFLIGRPHEYSMIIDEDAAAKLLSAYTLGEESL